MKQPINEIKRMQQLAGILKENEAPKSITVELLDNWNNYLKSMKSDNLTGHSIFNKEVTLRPGMVVKIGAGPFEMKENRRVFYWAEYVPENNEIQIHATFCFGDGIQRHEDLNFSPSSAPQLDFGGNEANKNGCMFRFQSYCKFPNGFNVGETDKDSYFKITAIN